MKIVARILINAIALWVAAQLLAGLTLADDFISVIIVAVIFGLVNAFIRPIVKLLTLPINVVTLGLFTLVINALMLMLTDWLTDFLTLTADGVLSRFLDALIAAIIISIVSLIASWLLPD